MTITIVNNLDETLAPGFVDRAVERFIDPELIGYSRDLWREQIRYAYHCAHDDEEEPLLQDTLVHFISFPWKMIFAIITPPPILLGGWLSFVVCLILVGLIAALIGDCAENFGCCFGFSNMVTGILVVAPGMSLPDLFASQFAAVNDEYADASLVNVTGGNAVKVFFGIGLPWTVAAIYWQSKGEVGAPGKWKSENIDFDARYPDGAFIVSAGSLSYNIAIFTSVAIVSLAFLRIKRLLDGGELGGIVLIRKKGVAYACILLWAWYLVWNILEQPSIGLWISFSFAGVAAIATGGVELGCRTGRLLCKDPSAIFLRKLKSPDVESILFSTAPEERTSTTILGNVQEDAAFIDEEEHQGDDDSASKKNDSGKTAKKKKKKAQGPPKKPHK